MSMLNHFICFTCRKGFKSILRYNQHKVCPQCGKEMVSVGVTFRVPKQRDKKVWAKIRKEWLKGNHFHSTWWPF